MKKLLLVMICIGVFVLPACSDSEGEDSGDLQGDTVADAGDMPEPDADTSPDVDTTDASEELTDYPRPAVVEAPSGPVEGIEAPTYRRFLGIPYAQPPVGELRWKPPEPVAPWTTTLDATRYGPICPQIPATGGQQINGEEDCLTLNIWTPGSGVQDAPVMVWLHGGAFVLGSGSEPTYVGDQLAEMGSVVVTLNYRLGPLGFLAHPELTAEDPEYPASGNYGLEDQRMALEWVRDNIAAFGGNPDDITLFGESAGGISTCWHMVSPPSQGMFHKAIIQSGPCVAARNLGASLETAEAQGESLATAVDCETSGDVLSCLRSRSVSEILNALPPSSTFLFGDGASWAPVQDGVNILEPASETIAAGDAADIPLIIGSNADEGTLFVFLASQDITEMQFENIVADTFGAAAQDVLEQYPVSSFESANDALATLLGDIFTCGTRETARAFATAGNDVWLYHFSYPFETLIFQGLGAFHAAELAFVFGNGFVGTMLSPMEEVLSDLIQEYWSVFAASGNPNGDGRLMWPPYDAQSDQHMELDLEPSVGSQLRKDRCDVLSQLSF